MVLAYNQFVRSDAYETEFMTENCDRFAIALADGMGGHNAGEVASEETLSNLKFFIGDMPKGLTPDEFHQMINEWLKSINQIINSQGLADSSLREMGTTLVGVLYYNGRYYWANCGDSRLYRLRQGHLVQLTTDHSLVNPNSAKKHSSIVTNCIGAGCRNSYFDFCDMTDEVLPGDTYMLCSDGLNDMISDEKIEELMNAQCSANALCEAAIAAGGFDNVSTCIFHIYPSN
jgi:protein phosphatase